jgi:hypothetical protein
VAVTDREPTGARHQFVHVDPRGGRWRIICIVWDTERPGVTLPETLVALHRPPIPPPPHHGGCLCGSVRYSYNAAPLATVACHCRDCQKLTGATNLLTIYAERAAFRLEKGELARYRKRADSGREADYVRCANCSTRVWHEPLNAPQYVFIAAGTLDDPSWVVPAAHIWTSRAAPSARIPKGVHACQEGPADRAELIVAFNAAYGIC